MDKSITVMSQSDHRNSGYVPGTAQERIAMVWPLTCEAVSLEKKYDVEQPLQKHIVTIVRGWEKTSHGGIGSTNYANEME